MYVTSFPVPYCDKHLSCTQRRLDCSASVFSVLVEPVKEGVYSSRFQRLLDASGDDYVVILL